MGLINKNFVQFGLPMIVFIVGGSFALQFFTDIRYKMSSHKQNLGMTEELRKTFKKKTSLPKTLEEEYLDMKKNVNIDNWENKRGPRPWEE